MKRDDKNEKIWNFWIWSLTYENPVSGKQTVEVSKDLMFDIQDFYANVLGKGI